MLDMIGQMLSVGDLVIDARLEPQRVRATPDSIESSRVAYTDKGIIRLEGALKLSADVQKGDYRRLYDNAAAQRQTATRSEIKSRKRRFFDRLAEEKEGKYRD